MVLAIWHISKKNQSYAILPEDLLKGKEDDEDAGIETDLVLEEVSRFEAL